MANPFESAAWMPFTCFSFIMVMMRILIFEFRRKGRLDFFFNIVERRELIFLYIIKRKLVIPSPNSFIPWIPSLTHFWNTLQCFVHFIKYNQFRIMLISTRASNSLVIYYPSTFCHHNLLNDSYPRIHYISDKHDILPSRNPIKEKPGRFDWIFMQVTFSSFYITTVALALVTL